MEHSGILLKVYISLIQVGNYKSFRETQPLEFSPGFNIVSGQNNAGKSSLLEVLGLNFTANPHRSIRTLPARDTVPNQVSWVNISLVLSGNEVRELVLSGLRTFQLVKPALDSPFAQRIGFRDDSLESAQRLAAAIFAEERLTFSLHKEVSKNSTGWRVEAVPSFGLYPPQRGGVAYNYFGMTLNHAGIVSGVQNHSNPAAVDIGAQLGDYAQRHVYKFAAERKSIGRSAHGANPHLSPDAANLAEVLGVLQANPGRFREFNKELCSIFPQARHVSVASPAAGQVEVVVWCHDPETKREDLAVPLAESGTGIGQVLAILYVVMTSDRPQTILIDEPQSFLHPGAARKLVEFLGRNGQHQYIIATHSATIIASADPKTITLVRFDNGESTVQQLDVANEKAIQTTLAELGVRLSDSFGADNILWVEGRTEEKCFRLIVERMLRRSPKGTEILGIRQTGDLESRDAKKIFEIYRNLTSGGSLLPPAIAFILDQECRSEDAKRELLRLSEDRARFLPRRMFENYLLNAAAIAHVINAVDGTRPTPLTPEVVSVAIEARLNNASYFCANAQGTDLTIRLPFVDGARILKEIFSELSETRVTYEKVRHGIVLTEWLIANSPADLHEVSELLQDALSPAVTPTSA
jgi:predicted ATPase